ncbi:MAG: MFS transporter [Gemmatimonadota bacterium]|jgi:UMF1 family MFS transporter
MDRKRVVAWALYDFAGSVYSAVIATVLFSVYFIETIVGNEAGRGDELWGWVMSVSVAMVAVSSPLFGGIADRAGVRKRFLVAYTLFGAGAVALFATLEPGMVVTAAVLAVMANFGFEGALVFYNAWLPEIADREHQGRVSALGFGLGYAASALGLLAAVPLAVAERYDVLWIAVALWWVGFSLPAFLVLPEAPGRGEGIVDAAVRGLRDFRGVAGDVLAVPDLRRFLLAFFFYIDGVLTVIVFAASYSTGTLGFSDLERIGLFLVVQLSALAGAFAMAKPTDVIGPRRVITGVIVLWVAVVVAAYFIDSKTAFFVAAVVAGSGLGSIQAASRSFMATLIPEGKEAEMFGFYAFCGKSSSILGPLIFGTVSAWTGGNQRLAILSLIPMFVIGGTLLQRVRDPVAQRRALEGGAA